MSSGGVVSKGEGSGVGRAGVGGSVFDPCDAVAALATGDSARADSTGVEGALACVRRLEGWLDAVKITAARRLEELRSQGAAPRPEVVLSELWGRRDAGRIERRAALVVDAPVIAGALEAGAITAAHADAVSAAVKATPAVADHHEELAAAAATMGPDRFGEHCRRMAFLLADDGGVSRLEAQRTATRVRRWIDHVTGLYHLTGAFDPERGAQMWTAIDTTVERRFHRGVDPHLDNDQRAAAALHALAIGGRGGASRDATSGTRVGVRGDTTSGARDGVRGDATSGTRVGVRGDATSGTRVGVRGDATSGTRVGTRGNATAGDDGPDDGLTDGHTAMPVTMHVHVDLETLRSGLHQRSVVDVCGGGDLPVATLRRMACDAEIVPTVLDGNGVVVDVGRGRRLATGRQRQALRAMYRTCAIPGCTVRFEHTTIHHLVPWEQGGATDMANLLPLCSRHHHDAHEGGWHYALDAGTRALTIHRPDGTHHGTTPLRPGARPPPGRMAVA